MVKDYEVLREAVSKVSSERSYLAIGRSNRLVIPRRYHLTEVKLARYRAIFEKGDLPNPCNHGALWFAYESLKALGINEVHSWASFILKFQDLANVIDRSGKLFIDRYKNKVSRNDKTGLNWEGRLEQAIRLQQRLSGYHPYGLKYLELGQKVLGTRGITWDMMIMSDQTVGIRLNTDNDNPVKLLKR